MLMPAILYKDEIIRKGRELKYSEKMLYFNGCIEDGDFQIDEGPSCGRYQYAIVDDKTKDLIGYVGYHIDYYNSNCYGFGLISFVDTPGLNLTIYYALRQVIRDISRQNIHRIEFRAISGNPAVLRYDGMVRLFNKRREWSGRRLTMFHTFKDRSGEWRDSYIYEIIKWDSSTQKICNIHNDLDQNLYGEKVE